MSGTAPDPVVAVPAEAAPPPAPEPVAAAVETAPEAPAVAPVAETAPAAEPSAPEAPKPATSLLSEPVAPDPNAEPIAPEPLTYEPFTWPEGVEADDAALAPYTDVLAAHRVPQEAAQALLDLHIAETQRVAEAFRAEQQSAWDATRADWRDRFMADEQIGGNRQQTTLARASEVIDRFAGTPEQAKELRDVLALTGAGDHPALIRAFANIAKAFSEGRPVPAAMAKGPAPRSTPRSRYTSMNGAA